MVKQLTQKGNAQGDDARVIARDKQAHRRRLELRDKIQVQTHLNGLEQIAGDLLQIFKDLKKLQRGIDNDRRNKYEVQIKALSKAAEVKLAILRKALPDLRSLELVDPAGNNPLQTIADAMREVVNAVRGDDDEAGG